MRHLKKGIVVIILGTALLAMFQNCSKATFRSPEVDRLQSASSAGYAVDEDTVLTADLVADHHTLSAITGVPSSYSVIKQTEHGTLVFDNTNATFIYTPNAEFYGDDGFEFAEIPQGATQAIPRRVAITVRSVNDLPVIKTDVLHFDLNSSRNLIQLDIADIDNTDARGALSQDGQRTSLPTPNGSLVMQDGKIYYTPNVAFRGVEQVEFWAVDANGGAGKKTVSLSVGNPFRDFQPALAIRGSGCVACHANVRSPFVTDLGFGNTWFAAQDKPASHTNPASQLVFTSGNMYGDHADNWKSAKIAGPILVPKTNAVPMGAATQTLSQYYTSVEATKAAPAMVKEMTNVYIGAPRVADLEARFQISSSVPIKYIPNEASSPALAGLDYQAAGYYKNTGAVTCDGDLFLRGTVYLDKPVIRTKNGCRIHATGPIFLQENPTYENLGLSSAPNNTNLQLVSARAVIMGVGLSHCETGSQWYAVNGGATSPLEMRLKGIWTAKSHVTRLSYQDPFAEANYILAEAAKLTGYKDASCYPAPSVRSVHLERVLINAPQVQSRLTGNVSGVVITEAALFALNQFSYQFDDVFKRVPVLPLLNESDFLIVK